MDNPDTIQRAEGGSPSRRGLLRALGFGGAATAVVMSARPAAAQDSTTTTVAAPTTAAPATTAAATTTTAPPKKLQPADRPLLAAAKTFELTALAAYASATGRLDQLGYPDATKDLVTALADHHRAYAEAISALYGPGSPGTADTTLAGTLGADTFAKGDGAAVLAAAQKLEETAVDTHLALLGQLQSVDAAALVASIQIVAARHAEVLAHLQGQAYGTDAPAVEDGKDAIAVTGGK